MNAVNEITLKVNERGLMNGLKHAFTTKTTLWKELLQNSDRAGATEVRITIEEDGDTVTAEIVDDGCGITDMAVLLSVAESGWSAEVIAERLPYGMGFLSALYATDAMEIESRGFRVAFKSDEVLGFRSVPVMVHLESTEKSGTRLVLHGLKLRAHETKQAIREFSRGFPVRVFLDGEEMPRSHAIDAADRRFVHTDVGLVSIPGLDDGNVCLRTLLYLQGFRVDERRGYYGSDERAVVVHLDPTKFVARMPDRDVLLDTEECIKQVDAVIRASWRQLLIEKKASLPLTEFLEQFWSAIEHYGRDFLNDIALLPRKAVERFVEQPFLAHEWDWFAHHPENHVAMQDVIDGKVLLLELLDDVDADDDSIATWNYAHARKALLVSRRWFDAGHWAHKHVRTLDFRATKVTETGAYGEGTMNGAYVWSVPVVLCESFTISVASETGGWTDSVIIADTVLYDGSRFLVPREAPASGWAVQQVSSYMSEDRWEEDDMESDWSALQRKIQELRGMPPAEILSGLLGERAVSLRDYPSLQGKSFMLTVDPNGGYSVVEHPVQQ